MYSGQREGSVPGGKREMKYVREPRDSTRSCTNLFKPEMMAATDITEATPMTMPRIVSAERVLRAAKVCMARKKFSLACCIDIRKVIRPSTRRWDQAARRAPRDRCRRKVR